MGQFRNENILQKFLKFSYPVFKKPVGKLSFSEIELKIENDTNLHHWWERDLNQVEDFENYLLSNATLTPHR